MMSDKKKIAMLIVGSDVRGMDRKKPDHDMSDHKEDKHEMHDEAMKMAMKKFMRAINSEDVKMANEALTEWHDISHSYDEYGYKYEDCRGEMDHNSDHNDKNDKPY